jgi:hypothetical protein
MDNRNSDTNFENKFEHKKLYAKMVSKKCKQKSTSFQLKNKSGRVTNRKYFQGDNTYCI